MLAHCLLRTAQLQLLKVLVFAAFIEAAASISLPWAHDVLELDIVVVRDRLEAARNVLDILWMKAI